MISIWVVVAGVLCALAAVPFQSSRIAHLWPLLLVIAGVVTRQTGTPMPIPSDLLTGIGVVLLFATWVGLADGIAATSAAVALGCAGAAGIARTIGPPPTSDPIWYLLGAPALIALALRALFPTKVGPNVLLVPWVLAAAALPMALANVGNGFAWNEKWLQLLLATCASLFLAVLALPRSAVAAYVLIAIGGFVGAFLLRWDTEAGTDMALATVCAVAAAWAIVWLTTEGRSRIAPTLATSLIWFPIATLGFAAARGFGVGTAIAVGLFTLVAVRGTRLAWGVAPLIGLGFFRLLQVTQPETTRAFDLGQHYALLGFLVGVVGILAILEWSPPLDPGRRAISSLAWITALAFAIAGASVYLGQKGSVGLFVGLVASAVLAPVLPRPTAAAGAIGVLGACYMAAFMPRWLSWMELTRAERLPKLGMVFAGVAIAVIVALAASRPTTTAREVPA